MKRKLLALVVCMSVGILICACGTEGKSEEKEKDKSSARIENNLELKSKDSFEIDKLVFEDELITLTCKKIEAESIVFEAVNKTDFEIEWVSLLVSLDGVELPLYSMDNSDIEDINIDFSEK